MIKNSFAKTILTIGLVACKKSISENGIVNGLLASTGVELQGKPKDVTIITSASKSGNTDVFTWSATGGITENGNWTDDKVLSPAVRSPVVGTLHDTFTLNGIKGSLKLNFNGLLKPTADPDLFIVEGSWRFLSGTASYKDVAGQGKGSVVMNFSELTATSTLDGQVK